MSWRSEMLLRYQQWRVLPVSRWYGSAGRGIEYVSAWDGQQLRYKLTALGVCVDDIVVVKGLCLLCLSWRTYRLYDV